MVKLKLRPRFTNINIQNIDWLALETYGIVLAKFLIYNIRASKKEIRFR